MEPTPKSFLLDLLSTLKRGSMPVRALVEAGGLFGIGGNNVRVTLARLLAGGQVARDARGRYRLAGGAVARRLTSWRELEHRTRRWDGGWLAVHHAAVDPAVGRGARRGRSKALSLLGFEALQPNLTVRPDNLRAGIDGVRNDLRSLGLPESDVVFRASDLEPAVDATARGLWDTVALERRYAARLAELRQSSKRLAKAPVREAMVESFLVGGGVLRDLVHDPLLPDEICPRARRRALLEAMRDYDRLGRAAWAEFLRGHGVPHLRGPINPRLAVTPSFRGADLGKEELRP